MAWVTLSYLYAVFVSAFLEALGLAQLDHLDVDLRHVAAGSPNTLRCMIVEAHEFLSGAFFFLPEPLLLEDKKKNSIVSLARLPFEYTKADCTTLCNLAFH
jgi:hypothetical protein